MRSIISASILGLTLALGVSACTANVGGAADESDAQSASEAVSASALVGTYTRSVAKGNGEEFESIVLEADGHYSAARPSPTKGDPIVEAGTYSVSRGVLALHPAHAGVKRYTYTTGGAASLTLTRIGTRQTERFDKVVPPATCASNDDCATGEECRFVSLCPPPPPGGVTCMAGTNKCVKVAQLGDSCGFRTQTTECATGLDCRHVSGPLDALTCAVHVAAYDEPCGGFLRTAAVCGEGLECTHTDADGTLFGNADGPGRCREAEGSACGGFVRDAHECAYPLHCQLGGIADQGGVCQP